LTSEGTKKAAELIKEKRAKWKKALTLIWEGVKEAPQVAGSIGVIFALLAGASGYLLKVYHDRTSAHSAPTTQTARP